MYRRYFKRLFDIASALSALLFLSPLLLFVAAAIYLDDGRPVLFRQKRVGRDGRLFDFLKFRSMPTNSDNLPSAAARTLRVTRVGRIIRRTNIDELPQLINILRGEMSIVGPRPALPTQEALCEMRQAKGVMASTPGLTGLAQINSYDDMPESEKAEWDTRYVLGISFLADLMIIFKTFRYLLKRPPVY
jgi:O-antigen biosynthesis protein WbqP